MAFPDLFKLEKLTITAFADAARQQQVGAPVEAMFNPTTITQRYANRYAGTCGVDGLRQVAQFATVLPATLELQLLFDGTGVDQIGLLTVFGSNKSVADRIGELMRACYHINGDSHEPNYLKITWGKFYGQADQTDFRGRLASVQIAYQSFDRDGSPLRAQLDLVVTADDDPDRQKKLLGLNSPDVTHGRLVRAGDTLPQMTRAIYGDARHVAAVARANDLDQFRSVEPGSELVFPPLAKAGRA